MYNNRFVLRQAEHFADRLRKEAPSDRGRVAVACQLALGRAPRPDEVRIMVTHVERHGLASLCRLIFNLNEFVFLD
ncbi:MAG: hypothetical protein ACJA0V_001976 [Planctomycetota bacterium]|jgi:hypothetical protein